MYYIKANPKVTFFISSNTSTFDMTFTLLVWGCCSQMFITSS